MAVIILNMRGEGVIAGALEHLQDNKLVILANDTVITITSVNAGAERGNPAILLSMELPDGRMVIVQTTLALLLQAARILGARYGISSD
jgi:hypothetical protein